MKHVKFFVTLFCIASAIVTKMAIDRPSYTTDDFYDEEMATPTAASTWPETPTATATAETAASCPTPEFEESEDDPDAAATQFSMFDIRKNDYVNEYLQDYYAYGFCWSGEFENGTHGFCVAKRRVILILPNANYELSFDPTAAASIRNY
ncbi:hypothetical protein ABW19_dt0202416 [Dactylella cylindrospora]|nr:hypothetical protein ABW19_dt0202416 [Dactylella cylindrospora]